MFVVLVEKSEYHPGVQMGFTLYVFYKAMCMVAQYKPEKLVAIGIQLPYKDLQWKTSLYM
jgi:hypothetical protein